MIALVPFIPATISLLFSLPTLWADDHLLNVVGFIMLLAGLYMLLTLHKKFYKVL